MTDFHGIPAYILAGGHSRRFGEVKALYRLNDTPLIQFSLDTLASLIPSVTIITKDPASFTEFDYPVIRDALPQQTPLVGLLTGLTSSAESWSFFLACDMPYISRTAVMNILSVTADQPSPPQYAAVIPVAPFTGIQPLCACYHNSLVPSLQQSINARQPVKTWLEGVRTIKIEFDEETLFRNINRKEDLEINIDD